MLGRLETRLRRSRAAISRSEWLIRLLRLSRVKADGELKPGLVMIQIDGLSRRELQTALARNEMPFLKRLLTKEHYRVRAMYSGVPSTTPSVQGELFYGHKTIVPAFSYKRHDTGQLARMFEYTHAAAKERELSNTGNYPLLSNGSCYADIFLGGAEEAHFCPAAKGWGTALSDRNLIVTLVLVLTHLFSFIRVALLMLIELLLAIVDSIRGMVRGKDFIAELLFIPSRVLIVIMLRELSIIGVKMDVLRGLPIIHVNFLGYDEQSHRRGPSSLFAHWTLKGIDKAIAKIWRTAHRAHFRHYDVWIYSDHGQQRTQPYEKLTGKPVAEAVAKVLSQQESAAVNYRSCGHVGIQLQRLEVFGGKHTQRWFGARVLDYLAGRLQANGGNEELQLDVAALGPLASVYIDPPLREQRLYNLAQALVENAAVPLVFYLAHNGELMAVSERGHQKVVDHAGLLLGPAHPYLDYVVEDLTRLCRHKEAGHLVLSGYLPGKPALSFATENGSHGGTSSEQTDAFMMLPVDIAPVTKASQDLRASPRPIDLRALVMNFLNNESGLNGASPAHSQDKQPLAADSVSDATLRIMSYNVHSCIGMDGKISPQRVARAIARCSPDIVALQELDVGRARTLGVDQAAEIARLLEMELHFHPARYIEQEQYGDAILSRWPMTVKHSAALPRLANKPQLETRGALWVEVAIGDIKLQVINTHLGLTTAERRVQIDTLLGTQWLGDKTCQQAVVLCGDFNFGSNSREYRRLSARLSDAQTQVAVPKLLSTFPSRMPIARIDHLFVSDDIGIESVAVPNNEFYRRTSDHLPLVVDIKLPK